MPIIQPNNTTGLYGIDTTVQINNAVTGNSLNIQGNATITGNLAVGGILTNNYYYANGTPFNPDGTYSNVEVAAFLASGTLTSNVITTANVSGQYILGNGSQLTGLPATYGNANVSVYLASGTNTANIITTGNISGQYILGNGSQLTGLPANYGNANVATFLASFGSNTVNTTGNITGGNFIGSGAALTSITGANVSGTVANATYATTAGSATTAGTVTTAAQPNITSVGTLTALSVSGNVSAAYFAGDGSLLSNLNAGNIIGTYGNANVVSLMANFGSNTISTTGNITGGNIIGTHVGSGAALTSLTGANVTGTVANATFATSAGSATTAGTVTTAAQPNITSVGTLTSLSVSGNVTGGNVITPGFFVGDGSRLTNLNAGNITGLYGNANVANFLANFGSNTISTTGNITSGNLLLSGAIVDSAQLDIQTSANNANIVLTPNGTGQVNVGSVLSAAGNIQTGASVVVPNGGRYRGDFTAGATAGRTYFQTTNTSTSATTFISAIPGPAHTAGPTITGSATGLFSTNDVGNASIFGMYSQGSDARIWSLNTGTGNVNNMTFRFGGAATLGATLTSTGAFSAVGNVTGANINTTGLVSATGNVRGANIVADTLLTGPQLITTGGSGNISGANYVIANFFQGSGTALTGINAFGNVAVSGQTTVSADNTTDTLTLVAGTNITITTDAANNRVTITSTASGGETISPLMLMGG